jgi:hypothetical protein
MADGIVHPRTKEYILYFTNPLHLTDLIILHVAVWKYCMLISARRVSRQALCGASE